MDSFDPKDFYCTKTPVQMIKWGDAWSQLNDKEKLYAYYFSRACWEGWYICWFQRSYESPALFVLLKIVFTQDINELREEAQKHVTLEEWEQFIAYSAAVFCNCGNYRSFGDTKFVPQLHPSKFWDIIQSSRNFELHQGMISLIVLNISNVCNRYLHKNMGVDCTWSLQWRSTLLQNWIQ